MGDEVDYHDLLHQVLINDYQHLLELQASVGESALPYAERVKLRLDIMRTRASLIQAMKAGGFAVENLLMDPEDFRDGD